MDLNIWIVYCIATMVSQTGRGMDVQACTTHQHSSAFSVQQRVGGPSWEWLLWGSDQQVTHLLCSCHPLTDREGALLYVYPVYHQFLFYLESVKNELAKNLVLEEFMILPDLVIIRNGYLSYWGAKCHGVQFLLYHVYMIMNDMQAVKPLPLHMGPGSSSKELMRELMQWMQENLWELYKVVRKSRAWLVQSTCNRPFCWALACTCSY